MALLLDAGALISLDRNERAMWIRLKAANASGELPITHGGIVGQVWRDGSRQARLAQALAGIEVTPVDERIGRTAGQLLRRSRMSDVVDAALVVLAHDGDEIATLNRDDISTLAAAAGLHIEIVRP